LMLLLRERLERSKLAAPVSELELVAEEIAVGAGANLELFPNAQSEATSLNRFIERLSARLGPQAVTGLKVISDHRPERSQRFEPLAGTAGTRRGKTIEIAKRKGASTGKTRPESNRKTFGETTGARLPRPAWIMETPLELKLQRRQPVYGSPLKLLAGPERIESGWWDDALVARDYFIAENTLGQLLWIYREYDPIEKDKNKTDGKGWYLQGLFG